MVTSLVKLPSAFLATTSQPSVNGCKHQSKNGSLPYSIQPARLVQNESHMNVLNIPELTAHSTQVRKEYTMN